MRIFLISHKPDIDGVAPVILSKLAFGEVKYLLLETFETNPSLMQLINDNYFNDFDKIFITDLSVNKEICDIINDKKDLKSKVRVFDHHNSHLFINDYSFGTAIDINEKGNKESGTSLFYKYLLEKHKSDKLTRQSLITFVELVRQYDTWEWIKKYNNYDAKRLTDLFEIFGENYFIDYYYRQLINNSDFFFNEKELYLLEVEQARIDRYVEEKKQIVIPIKLLNYKVGLVYSENYRSELGNRLADIFKEEYDFIILVNLARGVSYCGGKDINLGEIAGIFGGKGHVNRSSSPLPNEIKNDVIKKIFKEKVLVKSNERPNSIYDRIKII